MQLLGVASNGDLAQALLDQEPADVVVLDLYPLGPPGLGFLRHAARHHPHSQVLVVTDGAEDEQVWAAIEAGATGYLLRHTVADNICASIHDVHMGGAPMSPEIARRVLQRLRDNLHDAPPTAGDGEAIAMTPREIEVLRLLARGLSFEDMGHTLFLSPHTVVAHVKHIYRKLAVHSRGEAVYKARQARLL